MQEVVECGEILVFVTSALSHALIPFLRTCCRSTEPLRQADGHTEVAVDNMTVWILTLTPLHVGG